MKPVPLPDFPVPGGCLCGHVRYELAGPPRGIYACHCKDCQRLGGAAYLLSMVVDRPLFRLTSGRTAIYEKVADSGRHALVHACPNCGTKVFNEPLAAPDILICRPGTLDDSNWASPIGNIWTSRKLDWIEIDPSLPNFEAQPESREPLYAAWAAAHGMTK